ncbi:hypothetical protein BDK51DRAFT_23705 [Blyttiomyces helicus]|uniref:GATOR2 complex protein MIO zinc-ribbon like domain-containing protein n=1 Tax=Blyttiomyces helicus TaxID=388810 RepID=A0A4P9VU81_9FUNG|nr:hypothetical protein BDK51DRAFT_23705 [Blyttiomyces helicus]|eukprot:RKO83131.1 hypothetical protein BDK51DRAFT_23705 [Blyttiomyces helicus]
MILTGNIQGILLTGLTSAGVDLFENYVDRTGDIQTACLLLSTVVPRRFVDYRVDDWVENYRFLLDRWQMYNIRAQFDIARRRHVSGEALGTLAVAANFAANVPPQVYVRCNFCNQPIVNSPFASPMARKGIMQSPGSITCCPNCRKPLPRCALCLLHLGTPAENMQFFNRKPGLSDTLERKDRPKPAGFDLWFTWCQTCRHGGHAVHILDWFSRHQECPVADCKCRCSDSPTGYKR